MLFVGFNASPAHRHGSMNKVNLYTHPRVKISIRWMTPSGSVTMERGELESIKAATKLLVKKAAENRQRAKHAVRWAKELRTTAAELRMELCDSIARSRDLKASAKYER